MAVACCCEVCDDCNVMLVANCFLWCTVCCRVVYYSLFAVCCLMFVVLFIAVRWLLPVCRVAGVCASALCWLLFVVCCL